VDWQRFLLLVDHHRVASLVRKGLEGCPLPEPAAQALLERARLNGFRALALARELAQVVLGLDGIGIRPLALKGPVLALRAYGSLTARHAGDLDLWVPEGDLERAAELLQTRGYRYLDRVEGFSPRQRAALARRIHHLEMLQPEEGIRVELHTRLTRNPHLFPLPPEKCLERAEPTVVAGVPVAGLCRRDQALHLCVHAAVHGWHRLFWLADVAEVFRNLSPNEWGEVWSLGTARGLQRVVAQAPVLCHTLIGDPLPEEARHLAERDPRVGALVREALWAIEAAQSDYPGPRRGARYSLCYAPHLRKDRRYQFWQASQCLSGSQADFEALPLPDWLFPAYPLLRPWLFARRLARRLAGPSSGHQ
jgi:hypothetical protein